MPRLPVTLLACIALAGATALAGCGSDDSEDAAGTPAPAGETETTAPGEDSATSGDVVKVNMEDIEFVPENITVKVGQKILWTNTDGSIPHTVTAREGADFDSGTMKGGDTFDYTPTKGGTIAYVCTIHANQTGSIAVTE